MGLAKLSQNPNVATIPEVNKPNHLTSEFDSFPEQFLYQIDIDYSQTRNLSDTDRNRIKEIYDWSYSDIDDKTLGNAMKKLNDLSTHLGTPRGSQTRLAQLWQHVHLSNKIKELELQRKSLRNW